MAGAGSSGVWRRHPWPFPRSATHRWPRRGAPTWCPCSCVSRDLMASGACGSLATTWPWCGIVQPKVGSAGPVPRPSSSRCWPGWRLGAGGFLGRPFGVALTWLRMWRRLPGSFGRLVCGGVAFWSGVGGSVGMTRLLLARMAGRGADALHATCLSVAPCPCILWLHVASLSRLSCGFAGSFCFPRMSRQVVATLHCSALHGTALHRTSCLAGCNGGLCGALGCSLGRAASPASQERQAAHAARCAARGACGPRVCGSACSGAGCGCWHYGDCRAGGCGWCCSSGRRGDKLVGVKCGEGIGDGLCVGLPGGGSGFGHYGDCRAGGSECYFGCPAFGRRLCSSRLGGAAAGSCGCGPSPGGDGGPSSGSFATDGAGRGPR